MNNNLSLRKPKNIWTVIIDVAFKEDITIEGDGASLLKINEHDYEITLNSRFHQHRLVEIKNRVVTIYATAASIIPCYARIISGKLYLSNVAENMIIEGETLSINSYILFQNMTGTPYPQTNIFKDILLCEASGIYSVIGENIAYKGSQFESIVNTSFDEVFEIARHSFNSFTKEGHDVNVLLSGGYDSRLNLCFALDSANRFGNNIETYHFYKDQNELSISAAVAEKSNVSFSIKNKSDYIGKGRRELVFDESFIKFHNGNYRDDLPRWHGLLNEIELNSGHDSLTLGLGAEAHKGKYYRQFNSVNDAEAVLGINSSIVPEICRSLGFKDYDKNEQKNFFRELVGRSKIYERLDQKVDFMHYHTYASNGWGCRTHDVSSYYSVPFPFVGQDFLTKVFSLPKDLKQDFYITKKMIEMLSPELSKMEYVSGNARSLKKKTKQIKNIIPKIYYHELSYLYNRYLKKDRKGRSSFFEDELSIILRSEPRSYLTKLLKDILLFKFSKVPHIRFNFCLQSFLYLSFLEKHKNVNIITK